jgi:SLT domain-containing protein/phage-related protein
MATVVGSVVARVVPDTSGFAAQLRADLRAVPSVSVQIEIDRASIASYRSQVANLTRPVTLPVRVEVDRGSIATYRAQVANLTQTRTVRVDVDLQGETAASARLAALSRNRTSTVNVRVDNSATRAISGIMSAASGAAGAVGALASRAMALGAVVPIVGSLANAIAALAPAAALAAPAIAAVGSAVAAIKLGTSGVGNAFKAAFAPVSGGAAKASKAANQTASAQRSLKNAIEQVALAKENAAESIKNADRQIADAERNLADSQEDARDAQEALNDARKQAVKDLADLQRSLKQSVLDERGAALAVEESQQRLYEVLSDSSATELQRQQAQLDHDRAIQNLEDQKAKTQELKKENEAAAKAGVEGSKVVQDAQENLADAKRAVADNTQAVKDAEEARDKAARDGARAIAQAQQGVADAQQRVAEAQQAATTSTSALNDAMSKLSPNAQAFVRTIQALKPAWDAMKMDVQDRLFSGISDRVRVLGQVGIPILRQGLTGTAGVLNQMAKGALDAVTNLAKTGMLKQILEGATNSLQPLQKAPGQLVTAFGQVAVAAQPSFQKLTEGLGSAITQVTAKMGRAFESGAMQKAIENAVALFGDLMDVAGNVMTILGDIFQAGATEGGGMIGVLKTITAEIAKITSSPEVQAGLKALFSVMGELARTVGPLLGTALKFIGQIFAQLGPPIEILINALGSALKPVIDALGPVLVEVAGALGQIIVAVSPLITVIGQLLAVALKPLGPIFKIIGDVIAQLAPIVAQLATGLGTALTPVLTALGQVLGTLVAQYAKQFMDLLKQLMPIIPIIVGVMVQLGKSIGDILLAIMPLIPQIVQLAFTMINALLPILLEILPVVAKIIDVFLRFAVWLIKTIVVPVLQWLIKVVQWVANKFGDAFTWLWNKVVKPVFGWIAEKAKWIYNNGIKPAWGWIKSAIDSLGDKFSWIWNKIIKPVANWIKDKAEWLYNKGLKPAFNAIKTAVGKVADAFDTAKTNIGKAWDKVKDLAKRPVKFIIDTVYNSGIVPLWNKVAGLVGAKSLKKLDLKGFHTGGIMPGYTPGRDNQIIAVGGGEAIMRPEWTRAVGPGYVHAMNALARQGGIPAIQRALGLRGYADGGIIGDIVDVGSDIIGGGKKLLSKGVDLLKDGVEGAAKLALKPINSLLDDIPGSGSWMGLIKSVPKKLVSNLLDFFGGKAEETPSVEMPKGSGVTRWTGVVKQALSLVDQSQSLVATTLRRMNQESGGNPTIVNKWDSNWAAGHPSVGLMQVIGPTFKAYAGPFRNKGPFLYGTSVDPLANVYASMRYALAAYGSLSRAYNRAGGYAKGGFPSAGELAWVGEEGPELVRFLGPAQVYTHSESKKMAARMNTSIPGFAKGGTISATGKGSIASVIGKAFLDGLKGTEAQIKSVMDKLTTAIKNAFKGIKSTVDDKLLKYLGTQNKALVAMAKERSLISGKIAAAKELAANSTGTARDFMSLSSLPNGGLAFNTGGIIAGLNTRLTQVKTFGSNLTKLAKMGISQELIRQIVGMGPDNGAAYAEALLKSTPEEIKSLNATQAAITSTSAAFGKTAADAAYDAGSQSGKGFLTGLIAQEKSITDRMAALAKRIQTTIKKALKIKSPSRVMAEIGMNIGQGLAQGIDASGSAISDSSARAASVAARVGTAVASYTPTERVRDVHFNASVTDKPTRQMIIAATKDYNALHGAGITY